MTLKNPQGSAPTSRQQQRARWLRLLYRRPCRRTLPLILADFTNKRMRYQQGCITRERRSNGPGVWIFRSRETNPSGQRTNRKVVVGTVEQYPVRSAAQKAAD